MGKEELIVAGFVFKTLEDAEIAREEEKKINYIESKMNYSRPSGVLAIYKKMVESKMFRTPIGYVYLAEMQKFLQKSEKWKEDIPISVDVVSKKSVREMIEKENEANRVIHENETNKKKIRISVLLNFVLAIMVAAMFMITIKGSTPNILNYEEVIQNKYAQWDLELNEREQKLREQEKENIDK